MGSVTPKGLKKWVTLPLMPTKNGKLGLTATTKQFLIIMKHTLYVKPVVYLGGGLVRGPLWPDRRDFCNYFGIILAPFRDPSDQMRFLAGRCSKMRLRPGRWGSVQRSPSAVINRYYARTR